MTSNFTYIDWAIVIVYLLGTVAIGLYANRYIRNMADYIVAGRSLKTSISIATMLGSEIGLVTVVYMSQKGFTGGFAAFHIGLVAGVACFFVGISGFLVVPLREMGVMTIPEFYGRRFGQDVRVFGGLILALAGILNMGVFLRAGAVFITGLTGLNDPMAVNIVMVILIALVLSYTILGGMVSVVITDYIQFVVLSVGLLVTCGIAVSKMNWSTIVETVQQVHGNAGYDPTDSTVFGPSYIVFMILVFGVGSCAVWPTAVMRVCAAENAQVVRRLYTWSSIGFMTRSIIPQFLGICALAYFWTVLGAESEWFDVNGKVAKDENVTLKATPVFLSQILPTGLIGFIAAGMLAAFMSTHDSYLLCWASVVVEDVVNPLSGGNLSTRSRLLLARVIIFLTGIFLLAWSLWYDMGQDMLDYLAVSGSIYITGAFALLICGLYWRRASRVGAFLALATGVCAILGLPPVQNMLGLSDKLFGITMNEANISLACMAISLLSMVGGSLLFPDRSGGNK